MNSRRFFWVIAGLGLLGSLPVHAAGNTAENATEYAAMLDWSQRVDLALAASGIIEAVLVQPGETVAAGQPLLQLAPTAFIASVAEARAGVAVRREEMAEATRELERANELYARTVTSTSERDAALLRHARATAALAVAEARLERARQSLLDSELRAPFAAIVLARQSEPGMAVAGQCQPTPLLTLARADEWLVRAELPAAAAARLTLGSALTVRVAGREHPATLRAIVRNGMVRPIIEAVLPRGAGLYPGQEAVVRLP